MRTKTTKMLSAALVTLAILLLFARAASAQNASPLGGVGSLQFFDNNGNLLTSGVVYIYQAGTTLQATIYVDSTGTTTQPNPVTFGSGARAGIWLANGTFVKVVLCVQNDGAFCAAGDILFTADQVPIGSSGGGGGGSPFTGIFISSTASPATSGTLRLASGDSVCWRNAAGSANLCFKKDSNDLLSWDGGSLKLPEVAAPAGVAGFDILWADSTSHRIKAVNNAGTAAQYVLSGNDISTTDAVTAVHFGANQITIGNTAPTTNQFLFFNGTSILAQGSNVSGAVVSLPTRIQTISDQTVTGVTMTNATGMSFAVAASTNYSVTCWLWGNAVTGGTAQLQWTGPAAPTSVIYSSQQGTNPNVVATAFGTALSFNASTTLGAFPSSLALINGANAGTVQLQINNNTGGDGFLLKAGSYCIVQ